MPSNTLSLHVPSKLPHKPVPLYTLLLCLECPSIFFYLLNFYSFFETYFKHQFICDAFLFPPGQAELGTPPLYSHSIFCVSTNLVLTRLYYNSRHSKLWTPCGHGLCVLSVFLFISAVPNVVLGMQWRLSICVLSEWTQMFTHSPFSPKASQSALQGESQKHREYGKNSNNSINNHNQSSLSTYFLSGPILNLHINLLISHNNAAILILQIRQPRHRMATWLAQDYASRKQQSWLQNLRARTERNKSAPGTRGLCKELKCLLCCSFPSSSVQPAVMWKQVLLTRLPLILQVCTR